MLATVRTAVFRYVCVSMVPTSCHRQYLITTYIDHYLWNFIHILPQFVKTIVVLLHVKLNLGSSFYSDFSQNGYFVAYHLTKTRMMLKALSMD